MSAAGKSTGRRAGAGTGGRPSKAAIRRAAKQAGLEAWTDWAKRFGTSVGKAILAGREVDLEVLGKALRAGRAHGQTQAEAARRDMAAQAAAMRRADKTAASVRHPVGESPRAEALAAGVVLRETVVDKDRPRHAVVVLDLPASVRALVEGGLIDAEGADGLRRYADDMLAGAGLTAAPGWLVERVDGGRARSGGRTASQAEAWARYQRARLCLTGREGVVVEAVMVRGLKLLLAAERAGLGAGKDKRRQGIASGFLVSAADRLAAFYAGE